MQGPIFKLDLLRFVLENSLVQFSYINMKVSEEQLSRWAQALSESEETRCQNAANRIREVVQDEFGSDVSVFLQGSYRNRTNIRQDSDVDIVVLHNGYYFPNVNGLSESEQKTYWENFTSSPYTFQQFKSEVHELMNKTFDASSVTRKDKCIRVEGNSYRVNADVVPCFVHKRIRSNNEIEAEGIEFALDSGGRTVSFPKQHYDNGVTKNQNTNSMYKAIVRILKNVRNGLIAEGTIAKNMVSSFLIECLVWNVLPHSHFQEDNYAAATRNIIIAIYEAMGQPEKARQYAEVNDLKWLFPANLHLTPQQAQDFMQHAWNFIGYQS